MRGFYRWAGGQLAGGPRVPQGRCPLATALRKKQGCGGQRSPLPVNCRVHGVLNFCRCMHAGHTTNSSQRCLAMIPAGYGVTEAAGALRTTYSYLSSKARPLSDTVVLLPQVCACTTGIVPHDRPSYTSLAHPVPGEVPCLVPVTNTMAALCVIGCAFLASASACRGYVRGIATRQPIMNPITKGTLIA